MEQLDNRFSKILIVGNTFDEKSGSGVTLTNLFYNWPKESIAVASLDVDALICEKIRPVSNTFNFGYKNNTSNEKTTLKTRLISSLYIRSGYSDFKSKYVISEEFLSFFDEFNPDYVYSALGDIALMNFILELRKLRNFKLVIHIWDDFIGRYNYRWFPSVWKLIGDCFFKKVINLENVTCLSIGDKMSLVYEHRYNKKFIPFHNPIDPSRWDSVISQKSDKAINIIYAGKINDNTRQNLLMLCKAIDNKMIQNKPVYCNIYSSCKISDHKLFSTYKNCILHAPVPQSEIPKLLKSGDFLFLPLGFDKKSIKYTRLSIPTKLTEYLISRTPIILNCPKELAVAEYTITHNAVLYASNSKESLLELISNAVCNPDYVNKIIENAYNLAATSHSTLVIRKNFESLFLRNNE